MLVMAGYLSATDKQFIHTMHARTGNTAARGRSRAHLDLRVQNEVGGGKGGARDVDGLGVAAPHPDPAILLHCGQVRHLDALAHDSARHVRALAGAVELPPVVRARHLHTTVTPSSVFLG